MFRRLQDISIRRRSITLSRHSIQTRLFRHALTTPSLSLAVDGFTTRFTTVPSPRWHVMAYVFTFEATTIFRYSLFLCFGRQQHRLTLEIVQCLVVLRYGSVGHIAFFATAGSEDNESRFVDRSRRAVGKKEPTASETTLTIATSAILSYYFCSRAALTTK